MKMINRSFNNVFDGIHLIEVLIISAVFQNRELVATKLCLFITNHMTGVLMDPLTMVCCMYKYQTAIMPGRLHHGCFITLSWPLALISSTSTSVWFRLLFIQYYSCNWPTKAITSCLISDVSNIPAHALTVIELSHDNDIIQLSLVLAQWHNRSLVISQGLNIPFFTIYWGPVITTLLILCSSLMFHLHYWISVLSLFK